MSDHVLTLIGAARNDRAMADVVDVARAALIESGSTVSAPDWLAPGEACDLFVSGCDLDGAAEMLRTAIGAHVPGARADPILQPAAQRRKRLIVADLESTLIENEMLDELAELIGVKPQVADITRRAMNGELDFAEALKARVALFAGLPETALFEAAAKIRLMPGAQTLVATARAHGAVFALATGGFTHFVRCVAASLVFDDVIANALEIEDGRLTGRVRAPIVDRDGKESAMRALAEKYGVPLSATLAVGDGANDLPMLRAAGLGVAFRAKPIVVAQMRNRIDFADLTGLLYAQGFRAEEFARDPA